METVTLDNGLQFIVDEAVAEPVEPDNYVEGVNPYCYIATNQKRA